MEAMLAAKADLDGILSAIREGHALLGPVLFDSRFVLAPIERTGDLRLDYDNLAMSAKDRVFPQREVLVSFRGQEARADPEAGGGPEVVFGIRPCDARAISMLDKVFRWRGIEDPYYVARRERTTLVTLACDEPQEHCFCTSVGGDPCGSAWGDVALQDLGDRWLVRASGERGETLVAALAELLAAATSADLDEAEARADQVRRKVPLVDAAGARERLPARWDQEEPWRAMADRCLGCGACAFVCPTCHCFDVTDEAKQGIGVRLRTWDSCVFPLFTAQASGHNPRPTRRERMRQRLMHKFSYCPENFGETFCVGCGRCVAACPVNNDIREAISP